MAESAKIEEIDDEPTTSVHPTSQNALQIQRSDVGTSQALGQNIMENLGSIIAESQKHGAVIVPTVFNVQNVQAQSFHNKQGDNIQGTNVITGGSGHTLDQSRATFGAAPISEPNDDESSNAGNKNDAAGKQTNPIPNSIALSDTIFMLHSETISKDGHVCKGVKLYKLYGDIGKEDIAVKFIKFNEQNRKEAEILVKLCPHSNVAKIIDCGTYYSAPFKYIYIAMELCGPQSLSNFIKGSKHSTRVKERLIEQLIDGIAHIHGNDIIHRDLKPDNILVSNDGKQLKVIDFGLSKEMESGRSVTNLSTLRIGTDGWRAPETYNADVISKQADIFSAGLVINFIWTDGSHAFGIDPDAWNLNIKQNQGCDLSKLEGDLKDLVGWMLRFHKQERPSLKQIQKHKWLGGEAACPLPNLSTAPAPMGKKRKKNDEYKKRKSEIEEKVRRGFEEKMRGMQTEQKKQKIPKKYEEELSRGTGAAPAPMDKELEKQDEYKKMQSEIEKMKRQFEEEKQKITEKYEEELKRKTGATPAPVDKELEKQDEYKKMRKEIEEKMRREFEEKMREMEMKTEEEKQKIREKYEERLKRKTKLTSFYPWIIGQQPSDGKMSFYRITESLPGYEGLPTRVITYSFPAGKLKGVSYEAAEFTEYLPTGIAFPFTRDCIYNVLRKAFNAGKLFKIQVFSPGRGRIVWNTDIPHITNRNDTVDHYHFDRVYDALRAKEIRR